MPVADDGAVSPATFFAERNYTCTFPLFDFKTPVVKTGVGKKSAVCFPLQIAAKGVEHAAEDCVIAYAGGQRDQSLNSLQLGAYFITAVAIVPLHVDERSRVLAQLEPYLVG